MQRRYALAAEIQTYCLHSGADFYQHCRQGVGGQPGLANFVQLVSSIGAVDLAYAKGGCTDESLLCSGTGCSWWAVNGRVKVYRQGGAKVYQLARDGLMLFYRKRGLGAARKQA